MHEVSAHVRRKWPTKRLNVLEKQLLLPTMADPLQAYQFAHSTTPWLGPRRGSRADAPHLRRLLRKPMLLPHRGWPMAAGPVSRLGVL